jgi:signal recognition particle receptor subunit beta
MRQLRSTTYKPFDEIERIAEWESLNMAIHKRPPCCVLSENGQMVMFNLYEKTINCKIVYYGTGLGGKTTNLKYIYSQVSPTTRGELISLQTETERTLFFDFMSLDLGTVKGFKTQFSLYTVPGQQEYNASRRLILNGADGIIFVADSDVMRSGDNLDSLQNMMENLSEYGLTLESVPWVLQYNKRDLSTAMPIERLERECNVRNVPSFEAVAADGRGVFATLKSCVKQVLNRLQ